MIRVARAGSDVRSAPTGVSYLVGRLDRLLRRRLSEVLAPHGLSVQQYTALAVLDSRGPLSNAQLAERSFVTPQTANEMIKAMQLRGWVERHPAPARGRAVMLQPTAAGLELLGAAHAAAAELEERMLAGFAARERDRLQSELGACVHALGALMAEGRD